MVIPESMALTFNATPPTRPAQHLLNSRATLWRLKELQPIRRVCVCVCLLGQLETLEKRRDPTPWPGCRPTANDPFQSRAQFFFLRHVLDILLSMRRKSHSKLTVAFRAANEGHLAKPKRQEQGSPQSARQIVIIECDKEVVASKPSFGFLLMKRQSPEEEGGGGCHATKWKPLGESQPGVALIQQAPAFLFVIVIISF